ncbi:helix-turn-helix domain-containing protein [Actinoplanes nipponensis]|uniref:helix-turn-helix domain-containing protein n=1 Tax=Actinoplanes nipponensis TaxID=135950 RepID=UPI001943C2E1|nr:helix-turn-helix transcriptional regulator [Actinoplanes nipponensis]
MRKITLSERERELIALLSQGHTDVAAAEQLGISPRSVTNILRSLMDRLGVDNRFQLGLALGFLRKAHAPGAAAGRPVPGREGTTASPESRP